LEDVQQGLADSSRVLVSLDMMMDADQDGDSSLYERFSDEKQANPSEVCETESLMKELAGAIHDLSEREQLVLSLYYNDGLTFKEIGKVLEITESRVCQLHARVILSLKAMMADE
jgi:RNA polymerase sigma factor for flagellar operon FliA